MWLRQSSVVIKSGVLACALLFCFALLGQAGYDHGPALAPVMTGMTAPVTQEDEEIAETYRLYCSTCHGDVGQGLTVEWRMRNFPEGDQNCWKSRCHAANHDPGGFIFPKTVPAIIGHGTLSNFRTAQDLYVYIRAAMPYYAPGILSDDEYRGITLRLVRANLERRGVTIPDPLPEDLALIPIPRASRPPTAALRWFDRFLQQSFGVSIRATAQDTCRAAC